MSKVLNVLKYFFIEYPSAKNEVLMEMRGIQMF